MTMEDVEKDVIPVHSNKRESFLGLNMSFPWDIEEKNIDYYCQYLEMIILLQEKWLIIY